MVNEGARVRMPRRGLLAVVLAASLATAAVAFEIPLPDLVGAYDADTGPVTATVDLGGPVTTIEAASIHLVGTVVPGVAEYEGEQIPWYASYNAAFFEPPGGFWSAWAGVQVDGPFDETVAFDAFLDPDWEFLLDGAGELSFEFAPEAFIPGVDPITPPTGTITGATLILEIPVVREAATWSRVKDLLR